MNFSITPLSSPDLRSQVSALAGSSIQSPEAEVDQLEREANEQAQHLPEAQRAAFRTMMRREIAQMRTVITQMRAQGFKENAINGAIGGLTQKFYESQNRFLEGNEQFATNKALVCGRNQATADKIRQCTPDFSTIQRMPVDDDDEMNNESDQIPSVNMSARLNSPDAGRKEMSELEKRKIALARCVQEEDASLSLCIGPLSKGLSAEEKKELLEVVDKAPTGAAVNQIAAPLAAVSTVVSTITKTITTAIFQGGVSEGCLSEHPMDFRAYKTCLREQNDVFAGRDPAVNEAVKEVIPQWVVQTGETIANLDASLHQFDDHMAKTYYTYPGIVKAGTEGIIDIGLGVTTGVAFRLGRQALTAARPMISNMISNTSTVARKVSNFIINEAGTVKLPEFSKLIRERRFYIKLFEGIGYDIVPGGKGSHSKMINRDFPKLPMVIIPKDRELTPGVARNLRRIYEKAIDIYQDLPPTINPAQKPSLSPNRLTKFFRDEAGTVRIPFAASLETSASESQQNILKIYETATKMPKGATIIPDEIDVNAVMDGSLVRDFGQFTGEPIPAMTDAIKEALSCSEYSFKPIPSPESGNSIFQVLSNDGTPIGVLKEFIANRSPISGFIPEIVSLKILENQGLKHTSLPELLWVGKYTTQNGSEKGLALYRFLPGETIADMMYLQRGVLPAIEFGRSLGEINAINQSLPVNKINLLGRAIFIRDQAAYALSQLQERGLTTRFTINELDAISQDVLQRPGFAGLVHGDAHLGNYIFEKNPLDPLTFKATVIDSGSLMNSVNRLGQPQGMPSLDFYQAINSFRVFDEFEVALGRQASSPIDKFVTGYREITHLPTSDEANRFAELFWEILTLGHYLRTGSPENLLRIRIDRLDRNFAPPKINGTTLMRSETFMKSDNGVGK